jgi:polygalacturonase
VKTKPVILIGIFCFLAVKVNSHFTTFNIVDFGAVSDGKTLNTGAIQAAIDKCSENGGGTVYVPPGIFMTGTIQLKTNINLYLESGSTLKGSPDMKDYRTFKRVGYDTSHYGIIFAYQADNVSITGTGTIDGNEEVFFNWDLAKKIEWGRTQYTCQKENFRKVTGGIGDGPVTPLTRPRQMVIFTQCKNVLVENVLLAKSPFWTLHFADCDGVTVRGVKIWNSMETPNSDGMDITSCTNVNVSDCDIRGGDDAIAVTGYGYHYELPGFINQRHPSGNINITNCNLQSRSSGIRIGSEDQNTVRNINISNINITNSNRGIGIFVRDSGSIENIRISQVFIETRLHTGDWWGNGEPIHISAIRSKPGITIGQIKNVTFSGINCRSENGILIYGTGESIIENVRMENIILVLTNSKLNDVAGGNIDLRGCLSMEQSIFTHDIPGLFARYVKGLTVIDLILEWEGVSDKFFTHGIEVENYSNLEIIDFRGTGAPGNGSAYPVSLSNGTGFRTDLDEKFVRVSQNGR